MIHIFLIPYFLFVNLRSWIRGRSKPRLASQPSKPAASAFSIFQIASILTGIILFVGGILAGTAIGVLLAPAILTIALFVVLVWLVKALK